ncbi:hypothetical protein [Paenibacillus harenae]|uniref:hypothetical protein n=1 Tax=Paenibacillus harenae TaxID=306543 RepID=UPI0004166C7F|nr:hypothetical protein [Paenibacillus harenae]
MDKIWKYKLHYIIVMPAILLIFIFKIWPFCYGIILSMEDYKPFSGIFSSEWVGFRHYIHLFQNPDFRQVLANTLVIKIGYVLASAIVAFVVALALSTIRWNGWRQIFSALFLLPFFLPSVVIASVAIYAFSPSQSPFSMGENFLLADPSSFRPLVILTELLKTCGIPIAVALAAIAAKYGSDSGKARDPGIPGGSFMQWHVYPALRAVTAFGLLQMSAVLSTDFELIHSLVNPLVSETGDTLDTFSYRAGLLQAEFSVAAAVGIIQLAIQLLFTLGAYFIVRGSFLVDLFSRFSVPRIAPAGMGSGAAGIIIASLYAAAVIVPLYLLFIHPFTQSGGVGRSVFDWLPAGSLVSYLFLNFAAVIIHLLMTVTLAYPLTVKDLPGRGLYKLFLLFALVIGTGTISEFMFFHGAGMIGTLFPQLFTGFFHIVSVFVLKSIFNSKYGDLKARAAAEGRGELHTLFALFIPKIWKPLLALGILQFVALWNSYHPSLLYTTNPQSFSPMLRFMQLSHSGEAAAPEFLQLGALLSLPPIILFLLFRKWLTSEVLLSQIRKL